MTSVVKLKLKILFSTRYFNFQCKRFKYVNWLKVYEHSSLSTYKNLGLFSLILLAFKACLGEGMQKKN